MKTKTKAKRGSPVRVNPIVRPLPRNSPLRHMRPPTKEFPFWYYTGPWPNAHALAEERSDDSQQRVVGGKVDDAQA
jgi:hypothetical protein